MLQQQLRQRDEDIAAKAAEIGDLKERVAELEKLKQEQQQLLSLKDTELAAAQQRLAEANKASSAAAVAKPATAQATPQASEQVAARQDEAANAPSPMPYIWGGLGLAALALLAWLLFGRRKPAPAPRRSSFDSEALAASLVHPAAEPEPAHATDPEPDLEPEHDHLQPHASSPVLNPIPAPVEDATRPAPTINLADVPATASRMETPAWHSGWMKAESAVPPLPPVEPATPRFVPVDEALLEDVVPVPQASPEQRMKLARAFLDIGDDHSAKQLLQELLDDADPVVRNDAARLLREIR